MEYAVRAVNLSGIRHEQCHGNVAPTVLSVKVAAVARFDRGSGVDPRAVTEIEADRLATDTLHYHQIPGTPSHQVGLQHFHMATPRDFYTIRIEGQLGVTTLSAFPMMACELRHGETVLTGPLDRSALFGVLAQIEALGLELLEVRQTTAR